VALAAPRAYPVDIAANSKIANARRTRRVGQAVRRRRRDADSDKRPGLSASPGSGPGAAWIKPCGGAVAMPTAISVPLAPPTQQD